MAGKVVAVDPFPVASDGVVLWGCAGGFRGFGFAQDVVNFVIPENEFQLVLPDEEIGVVIKSMGGFEFWVH